LEVTGREQEAETNDDNNPIAKTILMKNIGLLGSGAAAPNEA